MKPNTNNILFSGRANNPLYTRIVDYIAYTAKLGRGVKGDVNITSFAGGETYCQYKHNIRGKDIFIIQSTDDPNENWMELFLLIHAAKLASANKITAVIPYYSYARQDRKTEARCPISARLMLDLLKEAGATRIITVDIHNLSVQGMSSMPLDSLLPCNILLDYVRNTLLPTCPKNNWTIVSPDVGGAKKIEKYAEILKMDFGMIHKKRISDEKVVQKTLIGDVDGKNVILIDDMSESLNTLSGAASLLKKNGAKDIYSFVTHLPLTHVGLENLQKEKNIKKIITTDTVDVEKRVLEYFGEKDEDQGYSTWKNPDILDVVSIDSLLGSAIVRTLNNESISELFPIEGF